MNVIKMNNAIRIVRTAAEENIYYVNFCMNSTIEKNVLLNSFTT
jgi:hypothetical protein